MSVAGLSFFLFSIFFFLALGYFWLSASRDVLLLVPGLGQKALYCVRWVLLYNIEDIE